MTTSDYKELWATSEKKETDATSLNNHEFRRTEFLTRATITAYVWETVFREDNIVKLIRRITDQGYNYETDVK